MLKGWIGVDLDGTLAHYDTWPDDGSIGAPIPRMVERVKAWLKDGRDVRIMTARVSWMASKEEQIRQHVLIAEWTLEHVGVALKATCAKDFDMIELWDDRAVRVHKNEGALWCAECADHVGVRELVGEQC